MHEKLTASELPPDLLDHLTGIPNDRWLARNIDDFISEFGNSLALLYIDGDGLKRINDDYTHSEGDAYIQFMSGAIIDSVRQTDIGVAVHKSGDEFVLLLTDITSDEALATIAARIEQNLDEVGAPVSVGAARYQAGDTAKELIDQADTALAIQKQARREASLAPAQYEAVLLARKVLADVGLNFRAVSSLDGLGSSNKTKDVVS